MKTNFTKTQREHPRNPLIKHDKPFEKSQFLFLKVIAPLVIIFVFSGCDKNFCDCLNESYDERLTSEEIQELLGIADECEETYGFSSIDTEDFCLPFTMGKDTRNNLKVQIKFHAYLPSLEGYFIVQYEDISEKYCREIGGIPDCFNIGKSYKGCYPPETTPEYGDNECLDYSN